MTRTTTGFFASLLLAAALCSASVQAGDTSTGPAADSPDARLERILEQVRRGSLAPALGELDRLIEQHPNFRLAHLVRGDLLLARVRPLAALGNAPRSNNGALEDLRAEARVRAHAGREIPNGDQVPRYFLKPPAAQRTAILVDTTRARVFVYDQSSGEPRLVKHYYTSIGKHGIQKEREGDKKTPIGVYHVTSWIPGDKLPDLYGSGAFPINYPNARDRLLGRTGYGIWIHGVPSNTYARAPLASDGCVAVANPDLESLARFIRPGGTPVVIAREVEWVSRAQLRAEREAFLARLDVWRTDWESRDTERYLSHYGKNFRTSDKNLEGWKAHKRRVNAQKDWIKVVLSDISVFREPGARDLVAVTFEQDYRSSNMTGSTRKQQYWELENGTWKIVYEAPVTAPVMVLPESYPNGLRAGQVRDGGA